jgi:selenocysteine-specific elongation factor
MTIAAETSDGWFAAGEFRDRLESGGQVVGRKVAIQILDFFDRLGITVRRGDSRRIDPRRLDLFG